MTNYLKYASYIVVAVTIAYVCATLKDCGTVGTTSDRVVVPADSAFLPIVERDYRPNPLPFSHTSKPVLKLPKGTRESDVARTIAIVNHTKANTTLIVETKSGDVFIPKTEDTLSVFITNYFPAVVSSGLYTGIGLSLDLSARFSPSASLAFLKWYGTIDAPVLIADLHGIGAGIGFKFYHDIYVTPAMIWQYESLNKSITLNVSYQL
jgi:hypothetical protein